MASHLRLLCCVFGLLALQELPGAEGVNFEMKDGETKYDGQVTCGALYCSEEAQPDSATNISSLTVYKQEAGRRVILAALSQQEPSIGTFGGAIEAEGSWTPQKAEATLHLVKKDDCNSTKLQYACEVRFTDEEGKETVSSAVVDGEDVKSPEPTEDTSSIGSDGQSSVPSREEQSASNGTCPIACEEQLQEKSRELEISLVALENRIKDQANAKLSSIDSALAALKEDVRYTVRKSKETSENTTETLVKYIKGTVLSLKEDVKSVKQTLEREIQYVTSTVITGWTVIQRRSMTADFNRNWDSYKKGFGSPHDDFWLGNDKIHNLTSRTPHELRITLGYKGRFYYANYDRFYIDGENDNYRLHLGRYHGDAGDSLKISNNMMFSTLDRDNDEFRGLSCANNSGAWWYKDCARSALNKPSRPYWNELVGSSIVTYTEMKIRQIID